MNKVIIIIIERGSPLSLTGGAGVGDVEAGLEGVDGLLVLALLLQDPRSHQVVSWLLPYLTYTSPDH